MLTKMRRNITKQETIDLITKFREEVPEIHLRTTLMVGHPDETEQDFEELIDFVKQTKFERLGAFPYSHEEGTYSDKNYSDNVPAKVKQQRMNELMDIQENISLSINDLKVGKSLKVVIDREDPEYYIGRTEFDSPEVDGEVLINKSKQLSIGEFYNAKIINALPFDLEASIE